MSLGREIYITTTWVGVLHALQISGNMYFAPTLPTDYFNSCTKEHIQSAPNRPEMLVEEVVVFLKAFYSNHPFAKVWTI